VSAGVALVTGAARRIGRAVAEELHRAGLDVVVHYHRSAEQAEQCVAGLNAGRAGSALALRADLRSAAERTRLLEQALDFGDGLQVLVHNASVFTPTPSSPPAADPWRDAVALHMEAPLALAQQAAAALRRARGCIVHLVDTYAEYPLRGYAAYCATKAGLVSLTRSLALELAPEVRVNAVAPGAILWSEQITKEEQRALLAATPMGRLGEPGDIAHAVRFLALQAPYVTGQVLSVDGGRGPPPPPASADA